MAFEKRNPAGRAVRNVAVPLCVLLLTFISSSMFALSAPTITTTSMPNGVVGTYYSYTFAASGGTAPYTWSISGCSGACNTGMAFSSTGVFSGTPQNTGTTTFTYVVKDAAGQTASAGIPITIGSTPTTTSTVAVGITPTSASVLTGATQQFSASVSGSSNTAVTWQVNGVTGGNSTVGTISTSGLYTAPASVPTGGTVTVKAISAADSTKSASASVSISAPVTALKITTTSLPTGYVGTAYNAAFAAAGGTAPYTWSISACSGSCNTGLSYSSAGVLSGTPANTGTTTFTYVVKDSAGHSASAGVPLTISTGSSTSVAVSVTPTSALLNVGKTQQFSTSVTGSTNTGVTWWVNGVHGGNSTVGTISTTGLYTAPASVPSSSTVTVTAKSVADTTKSANASVTIAAAPATVSVAITPTSASLTTGQTKQFSATVSGTTSTGVTWQVNGVTGGSSSTGTISTSGLYTAPATVPSGGSVTVTARSSFSTSQYANATVAIAASTSSTSSTGNKWYVANGGSNNSSCGGSSNPCATPDYAYNNRAVAGDTVIVAPGTYDYGSGAGASFTKSGAAGKYITVTCSQRWACKIQNSVTGNSTVVYIAGSYLTFDGFEVTNTSSAGNNLGLYVTSSYVNITRNKIHHIETDCGSNGGGGIQIAGSGSSAGTGHDITMDGNLIYDISWTTCNNKPSVVQTDGILAETFGANVIITNNIVHHVAGGWGITAGAAKTIANNLVFTVANGGILLTANGNGAYITNNMVFNTGIVSGQCGIMVDPNISVTYGNNMFYGNKGANYCIEWGSPAASLRTGDQSVDPAQGTLFVNWNADGTGDYHLKSGAPAIDKGMSTNAPNHDMDSNARPRGAGYDIGPYEF